MKFTEARSEALTNFLLNANPLDPRQAPSGRQRLKRAARSILRDLPMAGILEGAGRDILSEPPDFGLTDEHIVGLGGAIAAQETGADAAKTAGVARVMLSDRHLARELKATRDAAQAAQRAGLEMLPLRRYPDDSDDTDRARPIFDVSNDAALQSLALSVDHPAPERAVRELRQSDGLLREMIMVSPLVSFAASLESGLHGVFSLFGAILEARAANTTQNNTVTAFTLTTNTPNIVVDYHYQARYAPVVFGRTDQKNVVAAHLSDGIYCFETRSLGTPPPLPDSGTHLCDAQHLTSGTVVF